jgi:hypothetical protein
VLESAWKVTEVLDLPGGRRYTVVNKAIGAEWLVKHEDAGWQFWNGERLVEARAGVRAAVLAYERQV